MDRYFEKFPTIQYNGYNVKNITLRVKLLDRVYNKPEYFYNTQVIEAERADFISASLYNDSYMSWLLYLSNNIVDPYYDWTLSQYDFNKLIAEKYGSVDQAQKKIAYWNNNWYENPDRVPVNIYNSFTDVEKKYYEPVYARNTILEYKRKEIDWVVNTNQIWEYTVDSDASLTFDEKVTIYANGYPAANGQLLFANSSLVRIHQVDGTSNTYTNNSVTATLSGDVNNISVNVISAAVITKNISEEEQVFWSPVTYYDVEDIKNTNNQSIRALKEENAPYAALQLKRLLGG